MENQKEGRYEVIITEPAEFYFYEILEYFYDNYPIERAEDLANGLRDKTRSLTNNPERGTLEFRLSHRDKIYRYILFKRVSRAEIKILYYLEESKRIVYVTDFFPTEKDDKKIAARNR